MRKKISQAKELDIWDDVLKKTVKSNRLKKAQTVPQHSNPYDVQIFELLVAESLNLQDRHTRWEVTQASHDQGVDLVGMDDLPCQTPFATTQYRLLSVGQVKRSRNSYKYENLRADIRKARGYWLNSDLFNGYSPKQFLFILSTDGKNGVEVLRKHLARDLEQNSDILLKNDQLAHVQLIDAALIIKSWKLHLHYLEDVLADALSPEEMTCFHTYVNQLNCTWVSLSIQAKKFGGVGEPITQTLTIEAPSESLTLSLFLRWIPPSTGDIQLLHPLQALDPRTTGLITHVQGRAEVPIVLRALQCGHCEFGTVELYSEEGTIVATAPLKAVRIYDGFCPIYYATPNQEVYKTIKNMVIEDCPGLSAISVSGCGGIGKSSLLSEAMAYAAQRGYTCVDLRQPKDLLHPRFLITSVFTQFLRPNAPKDEFLQNIPLQLKQCLGSNYRTEWEDDVQRYFKYKDQEIDPQILAECLVSLLLTVAREGSVFLWTSDMHWASKETLDIFRNTVDILSSHQNLLLSHVLLIFEGRSGEMLTYDNQSYYSTHWECFLDDDLIQNFRLPLWSPTESRDFLEQLFVDYEGSYPLYTAYMERIIDYAGGVPMHMLELLRAQIELKILVPDPKCQYRLRITRFQIEKIGWSASILDTIDRRIHFYHLKCSDFVDFCAILAALDDMAPARLTNQLVQQLRAVHRGMDVMLLQSGFLSCTGETYRFCHEHYQTVFRNQQIKNNSMIDRCLTYYSTLPQQGVNERYAKIKLQLLLSGVNLLSVRKDILSLLACDLPKPMEQSLYKLLLQLPPLLEGNDLSNSQIYFFLCESYIQEGSWKLGQECLEQLLMLPPVQDGIERLTRVKGFQELSNILADRLQFDDAIRVAESGLELAELCLKDQALHEYASLFSVEHEKLLARLAVCHWFSGDTARAISLQCECYDSAVKRKDRYSAGHVLYEIGTLAFHFDVDVGVAIMEKVLDECADIPELENNERTLIETQMLMGTLIRAVKKSDQNELHGVRLECRRLLEQNRLTPHSYEKFLCLTMRGICAFLEERDIEKAQGFFFESLRCALESDMPNLKWKALLHIAQLCVFTENGRSEEYAKEAKREIEEAVKANPKTRERLSKMFAPVLARLATLTGEYTQELNCGTEHTMISVHTENCLFVIMN